MNTELELQKFGLDGREARVYLAALKLGKGRVTEIAKESGYERTYCFSILENLEKLLMANSQRIQHCIKNLFFN